MGTALGITLTAVIRKGLELFGVGLETLNVLLGVILLAALATDRIRLLFARRRAPTGGGIRRDPCSRAAGIGEDTMRRLISANNLLLAGVVVVGSGAARRRHHAASSSDPSR